MTVETDASAERLSAFDVVVKSPGISPYGAEASAAAARGTRFIGGTALWFGEHAGSDGVVARTICVTGTKGKSTTTALLAHLLRAAAIVTALAGNIGLPLLEVLDPRAGARVLGDRVVELPDRRRRRERRAPAGRGRAERVSRTPRLARLATTRYVADKLRLLTEAAPRIAVLNANDPRLRRVVACRRRQRTDVRWFGDADGWHLREDALYRGDALGHGHPRRCRCRGATTAATCARC